MRIQGSTLFCFFKIVNILDFSFLCFLKHIKILFLHFDSYIFRSLGLAVPPRIRFLQRKLKQEENQKKLKSKEPTKSLHKELLSNAIKKETAESSDPDSEESDDESEMSNSGGKNCKPSSSQQSKLKSSASNQEKKVSEGFNFDSGMYSVILCLLNVRFLNSY